MFMAVLGGLYSGFTPVYSATQTGNGNVVVSGLVAGPPPSMPPTINSPSTGATFDKKNIEVRGECVSGLVVKMFRNNIFAGSALCDNAGMYSLNVDLFVARNDFFAQQYDAADQASPKSNTVIIYYIPPSSRPGTPPDQPPSNTPPRPDENVPPGSSPGSPPPAVANFQLVIDYDYTLKGVFVGEPFRLPISFGGGAPPYAISIEWGDGETSLFSRQDAQKLTAEHTYKEAGFKTVVIRVSDARGEKAFLQFIVLVNGDKSAAPIVQQLFGSPQVRELWPTVVASVIIGIMIGVSGSYALRRLRDSRTKITKH